MSQIDKAYSGRYLSLCGTHCPSMFLSMFADMCIPVCLLKGTFYVIETENFEDTL